MKFFGVLIIVAALYWYFRPPHMHSTDLDLVIFAASSTGPALMEFKDTVAAQLRIMANISASPTIARQIMNGAPCDFVLLADGLWMDTLQRAGKIVVSSRALFMTNSLVLVESLKAPRSWNPTTEPLTSTCLGRIAIAEPSSVPAGRYAKEALSYHSAWHSIQSNLLVAADVRQALHWVEHGQAGCAVVYATDFLSSKKVNALFHFSADSHSPIRFEIAQCVNSTHKLNHAKFSQLLNSVGKSIFGTRGFLFDSVG